LGRRRCRHTDVDQSGLQRWELPAGYSAVGCRHAAARITRAVGETILPVRLLPLAAGLLLIATVLWDAFETVVLPRTVTRRFRLARWYLRGTWLPWARIAGTIGRDSRRERFLAVYGPVSLLGLLIVWAVALVLGFGVLSWSTGS